MKIGAIVDSTQLTGDVVRSVELGKRLADRGHQFTLFTPDGSAPDWCQPTFPVAPHKQLETADLDLLWTTRASLAEQLKASSARRKAFYHCHLRDKVDTIMADTAIDIWAPSTNVVEHDRKKHQRVPEEAFGGVDTSRFTPKQDYATGERPFVVLAYGRIGKSEKGTRLVVKACEKLYKNGTDLKLILFDTPLTKKDEHKVRKFKCACPFDYIIAQPYDQAGQTFAQADCFVSAENPKYTGWSTTTAEAMAAGLPVVATKAGTLDLVDDGKNALRTWRWAWSIRRNIKKYIESEKLRRKCGTAARQTAEKYNWDQLADRILQIIGAPALPPQPALPETPETPDATETPEAPATPYNITYTSPDY